MSQLHNVLFVPGLHTNDAEEYSIYVDTRLTKQLVGKSDIVLDLCQRYGSDSNRKKQLHFSLGLTNHDATALALDLLKASLKANNISVVELLQFLATQDDKKE